MIDTQSVVVYCGLCLFGGFMLGVAATCLIVFGKDAEVEVTLE